MPGLRSVASRLKPHLPAILIALLVICYVDVFLALRYSDELPEIPTVTGGLDVEKAWGDLHQITRRPHPYNSHENDLVRSYLIRRIRNLREKYTHIQFTSDAVQHINTTYVDPPHSAYFESLNILVLIPGLDASNANTGGVLYSAHLDSVASGVGATDDGVGIVSMLGLIEYFAAHRAKRSVVFNFNDGEEDGLNGAMAFFKHPWSTIPDTFVNFEGSGAGGRPIIFRSTSLLPLSAAISNTHVHANVLSGDAFEHRLLRSRTDFTVYAKSLPASHLDVDHPSRKPMQGIDLAFYKHRSYYHTKYDAIPYIEGGKKAVWAMMDAGRGVGWTLANRPFVLEDGWGDAPVFFDLFNRHLVIFSRTTLQNLNIGALTLGPVLLLVSIYARRRGDASISRIFADFGGSLVSSEGKLFWNALFFASVSQVILVGVYSTFNPFVVYGRAYQVLSSFFIGTVVVISLFGYYYTPSPATTLASILSTSSTRPLTRLLINAYILSFFFTALSAVLVHKAGLGGTYFLTIWGIANWAGLMGEVAVGGFDIGIGGVTSGDGLVASGKGKKSAAKQKTDTEDEPVELRRSLRKQVASEAASKAASVSGRAGQIATLSNGNVSDVTVIPDGSSSGNTSTNPKKRGRPPKSNKAYVEVPPLASPSHGASSSAITPVSTHSEPSTTTIGTGADAVKSHAKAATPSLESTAPAYHDVNIHVLLLTRLLQLFTTVMVPVVLLCQIAQLLVDGMSQTLADGSKGLVVYATLALFGTMIAIPATSWILAACFDDEVTLREKEISTPSRGVKKSKKKVDSETSPLLQSASQTPTQSRIVTTGKPKKVKRSFSAALPLAILVIIFHEVVIKNLTCDSPFNSHTPLKVFFQQKIEFAPISAPRVSSDGSIYSLRFSSSLEHESSAPNVTTVIVGVPKYVKEVVDALPSAQGKEVRCLDRADRKGTVGCEWEVGSDAGLVPSSGIKEAGRGDGVVAQMDWFDANVTRTGPRSARFEVKGVNTRNCRLYFERGITGFGVSRVDPSTPTALVDTHGDGLSGMTHEDVTSGFEMPNEGTKQLNLWSRTWGAKWVVDVKWPLSLDAVGEGEGFRGRVACEWSEYDSARSGQVLEDDLDDVDKAGSSIPAFEEVLAFAPRWVSVSKLYHGMLEVGRGWEI